MPQLAMWYSAMTMQCLQAAMRHLGFADLVTALDGHVECFRKSTAAFVLHRSIVTKSFLTPAEVVESIHG